MRRTPQTFRHGQQRRGPPGCGQTWASLARIFARIAGGITVQEATGRRIAAHDAAAHALGLSSAAALLATPLPAVLARSERSDRAGQPFPPERVPGRLVRQGRPATAAIVRFRDRATGEERWARVTARPMLDRHGTVRRAVTSFHAFTALKQQAVEQARLAALVASSDDAIIGTTRDGVIASWNRGAERSYGYTAADVVGRPVALLIPAEHPDERPAIMARLVARLPPPGHDQATGDGDRGHCEQARQPR